MQGRVGNLPTLYIWRHDHVFYEPEVSACTLPLVVRTLPTPLPTVKGSALSGVPSCKMRCAVQHKAVDCLFASAEETT